MNLKIRNFNSFSKYETFPFSLTNFYTRYAIESFIMGNYASS